jgi:hypothetical protein
MVKAKKKITKENMKIRVTEQHARNDELSQKEETIHSSDGMDDEEENNPITKDVESDGKVELLDWFE